MSDPVQLRETLRKLGVRVGPHVADYVLRQLQALAENPTVAHDAAIPVLGADARTGVAVRRLIPADDLLPPATAASSPGVQGTLF